MVTNKVWGSIQPVVRCAPFESNGVDDGGNDRHRECEFNEVAKPYQHESIDRPKHAKTTIKMAEQSTY
jgi:hypothetical protein